MHHTVLLIMCLSAVIISFVSTSDIMSAFHIHEVTPDVIDVPPNTTIHISYDSGVSVDLGKELTPTQVKNEPTKVEWPTEEGSYYTICMTDPDAPSRAQPLRREVLHWLVVNIPGNDIQKGEALAEYRGSGAPQGTGLHRYIFLVYKQPGLLKFDEPRISNRTREGRIGFAIRKFAAKYNMGQPVAGNFFQAQYDDYVRILNEQTIG